MTFFFLMFSAYCAHFILIIIKIMWTIGQIDHDSIHISQGYKFNIDMGTSLIKLTYSK